MHKPAQVELQLDRPQLPYSETLGPIIAGGSPARYCRRQPNPTRKGPHNHIVTCIRAYMLTYFDVHIFTFNHVRISSCLNAHMLTCLYAYIFPCLDAHMFICLDIPMLECSYLHTLVCSHVWIHSFMFTRSVMHMLTPSLDLHMIVFLSHVYYDFHICFT